MTRIVRPCEPGTYRCATWDCGREAVEVETVPVQPNGARGSVAFYGRCAEHSATVSLMHDVADRTRENPPDLAGGLNEFRDGTE